MLRGSMNLIFSMVYRTRSPTHLEFTCTMCTTYTPITREKFYSSATTRAECFSPDKVLLFCYHNYRIFLTREIFCCPATTKTMLLTREIFCCSGNTIADFIIIIFFCGIGTACVRSQSASRVAQSVLLLYNTT